MTGEEVQTLRDALLEIFPTAETLEAFLSVRLDRRLQAIASPSVSLSTQVFEVIRSAQAEGWTDRLILSASEARPDNPEIQALARSQGFSALAPEVTTLEETFVKRYNPFLDIGAWRSRLSLLEGQVCRVEVAGGPIATGFLVGPGLVLTADFALREVFEGHVPDTEVVCRFDYKADAERHVVSPGTVFKLETDWLVARNPWVDELHGLGYVLMRVQGSPGVQSIGAATFESGAAIRRWIELPSSSRIPAAGEGLIILQHPLGEPLKVAFAESGVIEVSPDRTRVYHTVNTAGGSSGAPCFSVEFGLEAMHIGAWRSAGRERGFAVPIAAIIDDLGPRGYGAFAAVP